MNLSTLIIIFCSIVLVCIVILLIIKLSLQKQKKELKQIKTSYNDAVGNYKKHLKRIFKYVVIGREDNHEYSWGLTKVVVLDKDINDFTRPVTIEIHLLHPGLFIGKGGKNIDYIHEKISKLIMREVNFEIVEVNPWK